VWVVRRLGNSRHTCLPGLRRGGGGQQAGAARGGGLVVSDVVV